MHTLEVVATGTLVITLVHLSTFQNAADCWKGARFSKKAPLKAKDVHVWSSIHCKNKPLASLIRSDGNLCGKYNNKRL